MRGTHAAVLVVAAAVAVIVAVAAHVDRRVPKAHRLTPAQHARVLAAIARKEPGAAVVSEACARVGSAGGCSLFVRRAGNATCDNWIVNLTSGNRLTIVRGLSSRC